MRSSIRNIRDRRSAQTPREQRNLNRKSTHGNDFKRDEHKTDENATLKGAHPTDQNHKIETPSHTDHKVDAAHELLRDQLAPRIKQLSTNAVLTDRRAFFYYKRITTGRRCSCFLHESSPDSQCPICIGTGVVGGFQKYGTISETIDFTSPHLTLVNCEPNLDDNTRPVYLKLSDGFDSGYIEAEIPIRKNIGLVDTYNLHQPLFNHGATVFFEDPNGFQAQIKTKADIIPFLDCPNVKIRIQMERIEGEKPIISHFLLRYQILEEMRIFGDNPRAEESFFGSEFGYFEGYQEIPIFFDGQNIQKFDNEDILIRLEDNRWFKITRVNDNRFGDTLTSTDISARFLIPTIDQGYFNLLK